MHVLLTLHHELNPNAGAAGVTLQLGREYQRAGHKVSYFSFDNLPAKLPELLKSIIFPYWTSAYLLFNQHKFDAIDASTGDTWLQSLFWRSPIKPALIVRSHGLEHSMHLENLEESARGNLKLSWKYPLYHGGLRLWEVKTAIKNADLTLMLNSRDRDYACQELKIAESKLAIVPNGIPSEFINLPFSNTPENSSDTINIAQVGSFIPRKGIDYSIPALENILRRFSNVRMNFLGTGCSATEVRSRFVRDVWEQINVVPSYNHDDLPQLLQNCQIKLFPSLSEGFSLALIETMACGLVPITTSTPGLMELVEDRHNGILIPPRNSRAIQYALEELILDRTLLDSMRRNAYDTAQGYSWVSIARQNLQLYERVLAAKQTRHTTRIEEEVK